MDKIEPNEVAIRHNVSQDAADNIDKVQAELTLKGKKWKKDAVVDFMLLHFKITPEMEAALK